jgi:hypothetical protein
MARSKFVVLGVMGIFVLTSKCRLRGEQHVCFTGWLTGWLAGWLAGGLVAGQAGWRLVVLASHVRACVQLTRNSQARNRRGSALQVPSLAALRRCCCTLRQSGLSRGNTSQRQ